MTGSHIDFVLVSHVEGIFFNPHRPEGLEFMPTENSSLRFTLRPADPENDACGTWKGLECEAYATYQATKDQTDFVDAYNRKVMLRFADNVSVPFKWNEEILIAEDGSWKKGFRPRRYLCPRDIVDFLNSVESELTAQTDRFLKLLRWRQGIDSAGEIVRSRALYWRVGEGDYPGAPPEGDPSKITTVKGLHGIHWDVEHTTDMQELWSAKDIVEPLGHALLREAAAIAADSPRSSILIMTAALETAVKMHISEVAPDTAWLMEEAPSPPTFKILRDYIPHLHAQHGKEIEFWVKVKPFISKIQKLIETRNKVAHTGRIPGDAGSLQNYLDLVSDFLYLLDVLDGHEWAKTLVSRELRVALGWPDPKDSRITVTIQEPY